MEEQSLSAFLQERWPELFLRLTEHMMLTVVSTGAAIGLGLGLAILIFRYNRLREPVMAVVGILQTIPSLALLVFLMTVVGKIGVAPALIALILYALLPIARNTLIGLENTPHAILEAATGLGMTENQIIRLVRLPLAVPSIVAGIRTATVVAVGIATLSAFIGAGGLGEFINRGLALSSSRLILLGAIPSGLLAIIYDLSLAAAEWGIRPVRKVDTPLSLPQQKLRRRAAASLPVALFVASLALYVVAHPLSQASSSITIGSKHYTEQIILAELIAQTIEKDMHVKVQRRFDLGGTSVCHGALVRAEIDIYPEYTGTSFATILKKPVLKDRAQALLFLKNQYRRQFGSDWLLPFGFSNSWAIIVGDDNENSSLNKISDLSGLADKMTIGLPAEFAEREDGFPGLGKVYGLRFARIEDIDTNIAYKALAEKQIDVAAGNTTDGRINAYKLKILSDDRGYFPAYQAAPVVRLDAMRKFPTLEATVNKLGGKIDAIEMRRLNHMVDGEHQSPAAVAAAFLKKHPEI
ncbi:MAG: ABC transporter permease subunit [Cyanobacteria bacterium REEB67]|nr:ABC transporter permease subunit [Cyanobacteria bacterium REEB67]